MNVLVVAKKTNLELHGERIRSRVLAGQISSEYLSLLERTHEEHYVTLQHLYNLLVRYGINYSTVGRGLYWPNLSKISAVLTVGGDGTVLEASHHIPDSRVILIGIRSAKNSIGKLCHCDADSVEQLIQELADGKLKPMVASRLQAKISSAETGRNIETELVLNDFLYTNTFPAAMTRYKLHYANQIEEHRSSGLWVSTPCGSTAAILAAGGEAMPIKSPQFQYFVRELYDMNPPGDKKTSCKGFFDPDQSPIKIENYSEKALLACDGHYGAVALSFGDTISFHRGPNLSLATPFFLRNSSHLFQQHA